MTVLSLVVPAPSTQTARLPAPGPYWAACLGSGTREGAPRLLGSSPVGGSSFLLVQIPRWLHHRPVPFMTGYHLPTPPRLIPLLKSFPWVCRHGVQLPTGLSPIRRFSGGCKLFFHLYLSDSFNLAKPNPTWVFEHAPGLGQCLLNASLPCGVPSPALGFARPATPGVSGIL